MTRSITRRIATLGLAAVAAAAIGGTVSGAGDAATICRTWQAHTDVSDQHQPTWHPTKPVDAAHERAWHPTDPADRRYEQPWHPTDPAEGRHEQTWHPADPADGRYQHAWNPAGDHSDDPMQNLAGRCR